MNKQTDTVSRWLKNLNIKKALQQEYKTLVLSELVLALREDDPINARELAGAYCTQ